ncbi:MAG: hypothetical protein ACRD15_04410, partial [Vicinamibacterales bacterium]
MHISSCDDLPSSIPDISPGEVIESAARLLPTGAPAVGQGGTAAAPGQLFAAIHDESQPSEASMRSGLRAVPLRQAQGRSGHGREAISGTRELFGIARDFSPRIERHAGGTIVLDVAGLQRLLGDAAAIAGELSRAGAPRVAVAGSQTAAMLLVRGCRGITVATDAPETVVRELPIAVLQQLLSDTDDAAAVARSPTAAAAASREQSFDVLRRWGLTTLGELAALPPADLSARLGPEGLAIQRLARGLDPRPLVPDPGITRFMGSFELEWPIDTLEPLSFVFARLLDPLASALERADRGAVALHLDLRLTDRTSHVRTVPLPVAMRDPRVLRTLLLLDLESHPPPAAVDVVAIEVDPAPARIVQYSLLERAAPSPETLATLMARLGALVGDARCGSPTLLDSHRPDGFVLAGVGFADTGTRAVTSGPARQLPLAGNRGSPAFALRRFRPPVAVRVAVEAGRPTRV